MHIRTRRILFWLAVVLFAAAAFITIRYAQGYVYDVAARRFVRTGAVAVTANTDAKLFVDDELAGSLSFLGHQGSRNRLLPGDYRVRLVRDGWSEWSKEIVVQEGLLTDFPKIMLLPTDEEGVAALRREASVSLAGSFTLAPRVASVSHDGWTLASGALYRTGASADELVAQNVVGFQPESDRVLYWTRNELWVSWERATDYQPYRAAGDRELIARWSVPIARAAWFRDRDHIVVDLGITYRVLETDTRGGTNIVRF